MATVTSSMATHLRVPQEGAHHTLDRTHLPPWLYLPSIAIPTTHQVRKRSHTALWSPVPKDQRVRELRAPAAAPPPRPAFGGDSTTSESAAPPSRPFGGGSATSARDSVADLNAGSAVRHPNLSPNPSPGPSPDPNPDPSPSPDPNYDPSPGPSPSLTLYKQARAAIRHQGVPLSQREQVRPRRCNRATQPCSPACAPLQPD